MLVVKADPIPIECVVRGYLSGSGWEEYRKTGEICGISLPKGLVESVKLEDPIFTPATKAEAGLHDYENINFERVEKAVGKDLAQRLKSLSIAIYKMARSFAEEEGILLRIRKWSSGSGTEDFSSSMNFLRPILQDSGRRKNTAPVIPRRALTSSS